VDPNIQVFFKKPKNTKKHLQKRTIEINGIPGDAEYFIDGRKYS
jgi:hypothetical protein